jgi:hypothetical protein
MKMNKEQEQKQNYLLLTVAIFLTSINIAIFVYEYNQCGIKKFSESYSYVKNYNLVDLDIIVASNICNVNNKSLNHVSITRDNIINNYKCLRFGCYDRDTYDEVIRISQNKFVQYFSNYSLFENCNNVGLIIDATSPDINSMLLKKLLLYNFKFIIVNNYLIINGNISNLVGV